MLSDMRCQWTPEQVWCYFLDVNKIKCYVGVCYRTPTVGIYGSGNHDLLRNVINELGSSKKHFMLMGDCNYRFTSWPPQVNGSDITREATEFWECLDENIFTQHIEKRTRRQ